MTVFLFINNSFIKNNNNKEVRGAIIQYATMCGIWHFNFFFSDSLHLGYTLYEVMHGIGAKTGPTCICAETKIFQESIFARN